MKEAEHSVAIISKNAETLDALVAYLRDAGFTVTGTGELVPDVDAKPGRKQGGRSPLRAFVLFPDDFLWDPVVAALAEMTARHASALPILVTSHPKRFEQLLGRTAAIVPKPVWGWKILEVIRAHLDEPNES